MVLVLWRHLFKVPKNLLGDGSRCRCFNLASEQIVDGDGKGIYKGRQKGTTKASPCRARLLRMRGLTVAEIATALGTDKRTVQRYLQAATDKVVAKLTIQ